MENTEILPDFQSTRESVASKIDIFFDKVSLNRLASACGISKNKGVSAKKLLLVLFTMPFLRTNIYRTTVCNTDCEFGKDVVYDFLWSHRFSWRRLLLMVAFKVNVRAKARIAARIDRLKAGNLGDCESLRDGVSELRVHYGPGYRVYFGKVGQAVVLLLCGGDKRTQDADIDKAVDYLADFKRRVEHEEPRPRKRQS